MKILSAFSIFLLLISCNEDVDPIVTSNSQGQQTSIEIYTYQCKTIHCDIEFPLVALTVELFSSEEEALIGSNPIRSSLTNADGRVTFSNINNDIVYIKVVTEEFGIYIDKERINANTVRIFHDIRYVNGYAYNSNNDNRLMQQHISLSNPAVGQHSTYRYHLTENHISFTSLEYTDVELNVRIIDQLETNTFVIREAIDTLIGPLRGPLYPDQEVVTSLWRFENDSLHITPYEDNYFGSFAWNLTGERFTKIDDESRFSLTRPSINGIDISYDETFALSWWGTGYAEDLTLFGQKYDELITDLRSYQFVDGPIKFRVYNLDDGLVRSFDFWSGGAPTTHGFDLVLE